MNELPSDQEDSAEVDALYRRMSAAEASQPSEGVRLAVLAYATRRAAQAASDAEMIRPEYSWQRRRPWARPATYGALAAGVLGAFMLAPHLTTPPPAAPAAVAERAAAPPPVYADLNSSQLGEAPSPPLMAEPQAAARRAPVQAPRQSLSKAADLANSNQVAAGAPAAQSPVAAAPAASAGRVSADSAQANAAPAAAAESRAAPLRPQEDSGAALWRAAENGDLAALRELHQQHANLNATDGAGRTALMIATLHGHSQAVAVLLDYGADPNIADARGESPLDAALAADESEIIAALKRHGAR
jgi:hypothetical protein